MKNSLIKCSFLMFFLFVLTSCSTIPNSVKEEKVKIGVTSSPHGEILNNIKKIFGLDFDIVNYIDYDSLNRDLIEGKIDANFFQTRQFLYKFNSNSPQKLVELTGVHIEPLIIYSSKYKSVDKVNSGSTVYIPDDIVNRNRALKLLEEAGLIKVSIDANHYILTENFKNINIIEMPANAIPNVFEEADLVVMNTNVAFENRIFPHIYGIYSEKSFKEDGKVDVFVTREDNANSDKLIEIAYYLNNYETTKFIHEMYKGFVKPLS